MSGNDDVTLKEMAEGPQSEVATGTVEAGASKVKVLVKQGQRRIFKIIVIGDSHVGKTCLTYRFCIGKFPDKTEATIGVDFREKSVQVDKELLKLQLWDTAGQERFRKSMVQHYYRNVHAVVFVYDMTKQSSFDSLPSWVEECDRNNLNKFIPRILVGNKCDQARHVVVSTNVAQKFADTHNMPLFETSAKDDEKADHVEAIFLTLAHKLKNSKPMMPPHLMDLVSPAQTRYVTLRGNPQQRGLQSARDDEEKEKNDCAC